MAESSISYSDAIDAALVDSLEADDRVFVMATDPPEWMVERFGTDRVLQTPISEPSLTGLSVGAAICGMRPIFMWRNVTFGFGSLDQVFNQAAKLRYMSGGQFTVPLVIRTIYGAGTGLAAQHMQSPYAMFAAMPGLRVALPSSVSDAHHLMIEAIRLDDPVIFFEGVRLSTVRGVLGESPTLPFGKGRIVESGTDITIVALGYMVHEALRAVERLRAAGISGEVVDPRTLVPLDTETIRASVRKTGRLVVVDEAPSTASMAAEIVALVCEDAETYRCLRHEPQRVCAPAVPIPYTKPLEQAVMPNSEDIEHVIRSMIE